MGRPPAAEAKDVSRLPPLVFAGAEVDALLLGLTMVAAIEDEALSAPAAAARERIAAALPPEPAYRPRCGDPPLLRVILGAIAAEQGLCLRYRDGKGAATEREVWPILLEDGGEMLAAWCTLRGDFRHFRLDRMDAVVETGTRYPARRRLLLAEWLHQQVETGDW
jgi:predicted DNA-binding transcriptional regulator YafY